VCVSFCVAVLVYIVAGAVADVTQCSEYLGVVCKEFCGDGGDVVVRWSASETHTQRRRRKTDGNAREQVSNRWK